MDRNELERSQIETAHQDRVHREGLSTPLRVL